MAERGRMGVREEVERRDRHCRERRGEEKGRRRKK